MKPQITGSRSGKLSAPPLLQSHQSMGFDAQNSLDIEDEFLRGRATQPQDQPSDSVGVNTAISQPLSLLLIFSRVNNFFLIFRQH